MSANDVHLLARMIQRTRSETEGVLDQAEHELYFSAKHYLRDTRPSHDDLWSGIVDGTRDGGLDGVYIFANGHCLRDDSPVDGLGRSADLDLVLMQVKNVTGFGEAAIEKLMVSLPELLSFDRDEDHLAQSYNQRVIEITRRFLHAYQTLDQARLRIFVAFASLRSDGNVHENVIRKGEDLNRTIQACFSGAEIIVDFLDAGQLYDLARASPVVHKNLSMAENPIATETTGGYVGVVRLTEYQRFITDANGRLDASLFDANVRDYEGRTAVNLSIAQTLDQADRDVDFWWLNNGVTVVANRVQQAGKLLKLESPQIVNGLQTSHEVYQSGRGQERESEERSVLVKVIEATNDKVRDRIIRATNSQTALGSSALRATDRVQRQIEEHLSSDGLFYERRRNHYANQSVPASKLVSIEQMGKALISCLVQAPHVARGSMTRVFETDMYELVFNKSHPIQTYSAAISIYRQCESFLRIEARSPFVDDFAQHLTMAAATAVTRRARPNAKQLAEADGTIEDSLLRHLFTLVQNDFAAESSARNIVLLDQVAKSEKLTTRLSKTMSNYLHNSRRR